MTLTRFFRAAVLALAAASASAQTLPAPTSISAAPPAALKLAPNPTAHKPLWKDLSRPQQVALEPLMPEWDRMEGVRKQKWLDIAHRYASKTPDEQQRIQERMRDWMKLTPDERRMARENYALSKKIDKSQKSAQWEQYQQLPEEQKKKLAADAAANKQVTKPPPKTPAKTVTPSPAAVTVPPATIPAPGNPAVPVPNAK